MKFEENLRWWVDFSNFFGSFDIEWPVCNVKQADFTCKKQQLLKWLRKTKVPNKTINLHSNQFFKLNLVGTKSIAVKLAFKPVHNSIWKTKTKIN